ncbi:hypothetical protein ADUPG1_000287 [Aduncisulcus paluster]|uniref:Uncharacterized protein n=1 Tax=Aduncisulcus paluster TaxID=2918883 RepID=A0ABQ5K5R2_9EUKA|nr:hypothetical protein ADUPG1_000287 [Aduncisulcus paluster]
MNFQFQIYCPDDGTNFSEFMEMLETVIGKNCQFSFMHNQNISSISFYRVDNFTARKLSTSTKYTPCQFSKNPHGAIFLCETENHLEFLTSLLDNQYIRDIQVILFIILDNPSETDGLSSRISTSRILKLRKLSLPRRTDIKTFSVDLSGETASSSIIEIKKYVKSRILSIIDEDVAGGSPIPEYSAEDDDNGSGMVSDEIKTVPFSQVGPQKSPSIPTSGKLSLPKSPRTKDILLQKDQSRGEIGQRIESPHSPSVRQDIRASRESIDLSHGRVCDKEDDETEESSKFEPQEQVIDEIISKSPCGRPSSRPYVERQRRSQEERMRKQLEQSWVKRWKKHKHREFLETLHNPEMQNVSFDGPKDSHVFWRHTMSSEIRNEAIKQENKWRSERGVVFPSMSQSMVLEWNYLARSSLMRQWDEEERIIRDKEVQKDLESGSVPKESTPTIVRSSPQLYQPPQASPQKWGEDTVTLQAGCVGYDMKRKLSDSELARRHQENMKDPHYRRLVRLKEERLKASEKEKKEAQQYRQKRLIDMGYGPYISPSLFISGQEDDDLSPSSGRNLSFTATNGGSGCEDQHGKQHLKRVDSSIRVGGSVLQMTSSRDDLNLDLHASHSSLLSSHRHSSEQKGPRHGKKKRDSEAEGRKVICEIKQEDHEEEKHHELTSTSERVEIEEPKYLPSDVHQRHGSSFDDKADISLHVHSKILGEPLKYSADSSHIHIGVSSQAPSDEISTQLSQMSKIIEEQKKRIARLEEEEKKRVSEQREVHGISEDTKSIDVKKEKEGEKGEIEQELSQQTTSEKKGDINSTGDTSEKVPPVVRDGDVVNNESVRSEISREEVRKTEIAGKDQPQTDATTRQQQEYLTLRLALAQLLSSLQPSLSTLPQQQQSIGLLGPASAALQTSSFPAPPLASLPLPSSISPSTMTALLQQQRIAQLQLDLRAQQERERKEREREERERERDRLERHQERMERNTVLMMRNMNGITQQMYGTTGHVSPSHLQSSASGGYPVMTPQSGPRKSFLQRDESVTMAEFGCVDTGSVLQRSHEHVPRHSFSSLKRSSRRGSEIYERNASTETAHSLVSTGVPQSSSQTFMSSPSKVPPPLKKKSMSSSIVDGSPTPALTPFAKRRALKTVNVVTVEKKLETTGEDHELSVPIESSRDDSSSHFE